MPTPILNLDQHVALVDATGVAIGTSGNPLVTGGSGGALAIQTFADVNAALSPTVTAQRVLADQIIMNAAGNTAVRPRAASDTIAGVGGGAQQANAALVYDPGTSKFWPQQGTQTGGGFVQGPLAPGAAVGGNPVHMGVSDGTLVRRMLGNSDGSLAVGGFNAAPLITLTRGANTTAYTAQDEVATTGSAPVSISVSRLTGGTTLILGARLIFSDNPATVPGFRLLLFSATVTAAGDNVALNLSDADAALFLGAIDFSVTQAGGSATSTNVMMAGAPVGPIVVTTDAVFGLLITTNAFTPISNSSTIKVALELDTN